MEIGFNRATTAVEAVKNGTANLAMRLARAVTSHFVKTDGSHAIERINPIRNLSAAQAQQIFDYARSGNYAQIQRIYAEIERTDPTLLVCVMRRASALSELDWKVVQSDQRLSRGATQEDVNRQIEWLETLCARIENLPEAVEFLSGAAFRGFANVSPVYRADGSVKRFDCLDQWNMCWDRRTKEWLWNPEASSFEIAESVEGTHRSIQAIPREELVTVTERTPIDWPALMIYLRSHTAEHDWGVFLERYGLPPVILTLPDNISTEDVDKFVSGAESVFKGRNGVVPFGTQVNYGAEARGVDPFSAFIRHQQELLVLMATGGLLTSLAQSGSGTLAGNAHEETWRTIVRRTARIIADALNKQLFERLLRQAFPDQPVLAEFKFETTPDPTPKEVFELAVMARNAGLKMRCEELSEMTGYTLEDAPQGDPSGMGMGGGMGGETPPTAGANPDQPPDVALNAQNTPSTRVAHSAPITDAGRLAIALRADFALAADAVNEVLNIEDENARREKAKEVISKLDDLVPDDPIMAGVIAQTMEREFLNASKE